MKFILAVSAILNLMFLVDGYFRRQDEKVDAETINYYQDLCDRTLALNQDILSSWNKYVDDSTGKVATLIKTILSMSNSSDVPNDKDHDNDDYFCQ